MHIGGVLSIGTHKRQAFPCDRFGRWTWTCGVHVVFAPPPPPPPPPKVWEGGTIFFGKRNKLRRYPQLHPILPEPLQNLFGTLVEIWWNPRGTLPQGRPGLPRSLSGLRPQSFQLLGNKNKKKMESTSMFALVPGPLELRHDLHGGDCGLPRQLCHVTPSGKVNSWFRSK